VICGRFIGLHLLRPIIERLGLGRKKTVRKKRAEEDRRRRKKGRIYILCREEDGMASLTISPRPFNYSFRIPLTLTVVEQRESTG
jgi:hypothetical protein